MRITIICFVIAFIPGCQHTEEQRHKEIVLMTLVSAHYLYESKCASCHSRNIDLEDETLKNLRQLKQIDNLDTIVSRIQNKHKTVEDILELEENEVYGLANYILYSDTTPLTNR